MASTGFRFKSLLRKRCGTGGCLSMCVWRPAPGRRPELGEGSVARGQPARNEVPGAPYGSGVRVLPRPQAPSPCQRSFAALGRMAAGDRRPPPRTAPSCGAPAYLRVPTILPDRTVRAAALPASAPPHGWFVPPICTPSRIACAVGGGRLSLTPPQTSSQIGTRRSPARPPSESACRTSEPAAPASKSPRRYGCGTLHSGDGK